jgi:hypothetical protein
MGCLSWLHYNIYEKKSTEKIWLRKLALFEEQQVKFPGLFQERQGLQSYDFSQYAKGLYPVLQII